MTDHLTSSNDTAIMVSDLSEDRYYHNASGLYSQQTGELLQCRPTYFTDNENSPELLTAYIGVAIMMLTAVYARYRKVSP